MQKISGTLRKRCLLLIFASAAWGTVHAQQTLTGRVTDNGGKALPYAAVAVHPLAGTNVFFSSRADSAGIYRVEDLARGSYTLKVSFMGYVLRRNDTIIIREGERLIRYDPVMHPVATDLSGITISARKPSVVAEKGKIVYNVQNAANGAGQTALEILSKIPGVSVDSEGNISYSGSTGVNVMVNGRMTWLSGPQLANYLRGINAEDIGKVEMITAPDASFDAAGNAGIINIVSRKKPVQGLAVDLRSAVSAGHYVMTNQNISLNYNAGTIALYGSFDYTTPHRFIDRKGGNIVPGTDDMFRLHRNTASGYRIRYYTWRAGAEWKPHPKHTAAVNYHGYLDDFTCFHHTDLYTKDLNGRRVSSTRSMNEIVEPYHYDAVNFHYRYDIDSTGKKIGLDADYTAYRNFSDALMTMQHFSGDGSLAGDNLLSSYQPGFVKIRSLKTDADLPFGRLLIKAGLKYAEVSNDNNYRFDSLTNGSMQTIANMSNHFRYNERIAAVYVSADRTSGNTQVSFGLRLEHTKTGGHTVRENIFNHREYTQLFPSLSLEQTLGRDLLNLTISRRINRPAYADLNPVRWYRDEYFYYTGNPDLVPELAWNIASVYNLRRKYILGLTYRHSNRYMSERLAFDDHSPAIKSQKSNFGALKRVELTAAIPVNMLKVWEFQWNTNLSYTTYPVAMTTGDRHVSQWAAAFSLLQEFSLPAGFKATVNAYFTTAELRGIFRVRQNGYIDAGIKRAFLQKRLNVQLSVSDILNTSRLKGHSLTDFTDFWYNDKPDSRRTGISVIWHFGGRSLKPSNKKTDEQERL